MVFGASLVPPRHKRACPPMQPPKYITTNGHAVFDLQTEQLREFDNEFLSSFDVSWSFAIRKPTWRDILRNQYMNGTVRNQELLESMSTLCQNLCSGLTRECSITLPLVKGTDDTQVKRL